MGESDPREARRRVMHRLGVLAAVLSMPALLGADDPFSGVWKLNLAKSELTPPVPRSHRAIIHAAADGVRVREEIVSDKGEEITVTFEAKFDGRDYAVSGSAMADTVAMTRVNAHTIKSVVKKACKVVLSETEVISMDGKTLRANYSAVDAEGKPIIGTAILEKIE